jgi:RNA polymerase sigma factor (TIGR02999 family)
LRLIDEKGVDWRDRAHFFGVAAHLMRFVLVDYARRRASAKRGGAEPLMMLDEQGVQADDPAFGLLAVDRALEKLAALDERQSRVAELKLFAGLTLDETAEVLAVSAATVTRDWRLAKAWLQRELA